MTKSLIKFLLGPIPRKYVVDNHWFYPIDVDDTGRTCSMTCSTKLLRSQGVNVGIYK